MCLVEEESLYRMLPSLLTIVGHIALVDGDLLEHVRSLIAYALENGQLKHLLQSGLWCLTALGSTDDDHLLEGVARVQQLLQQHLAHKPRGTRYENGLILVVFLHG